MSAIHSGTGAAGELGAGAGGGGGALWTALGTTTGAAAAAMTAARTSPGTLGMVGTGRGASARSPSRRGHIGATTWGVHRTATGTAWGISRERGATATAVARSGW